MLSNLLQLELHMAVHSHVGTGNQIKSSARAASTLEFLNRRDLEMVVQLEEDLVLYKNLIDLLRLIWN